MDGDKQISEVDRARLAAIIDCEAHIEITRSGRRHKLYVTVGAKARHTALLRWCKDKFNGFICANDYKKDKGPTYAPVMRWRVSGQAAASALKASLPYFLIKREQAEIAIEFQERVASRPPGRLTNNDIAWRDDCYARLRSLTKTGR